jgi:hypothetical protein
VKRDPGFFQPVNKVACAMTCDMRVKPLHALCKEEHVLLTAANLGIVNHQEDPVL